MHAGHTCQAQDLVVEGLALRGPARLLAGQRAQQRVGRVHARLCRGRVRRQRLLLRHGRIELRLRTVRAWGQL